MKTKKPDFSYENKLWKDGYKFIGGIDEVGRGALAGDVVTACVIFNNKTVIIPDGIIINDSKKLSPKKREIANYWIRRNCLAYGLGSASSKEIDKLGIVKATQRAFRKAIIACSIKIDHLLIDAFYIPYVKGINHKNQTPIIKGDGISISIAAASIVAKVERDNLMRKLGTKKEFSVYNWEKNKGYGTKDHQIALRKYGKTRLHRVSFLLNFS